MLEVATTPKELTSAFELSLDGGKNFGDSLSCRRRIFLVVSSCAMQVIRFSGVNRLKRLGTVEVCLLLEDEVEVEREEPCDDFHSFRG